MQRFAAGTQEPIQAQLSESLVSFLTKLTGILAKMLKFFEGLCITDKNKCIYRKDKNKCKTVCYNMTSKKLKNLSACLKSLELSIGAPHCY